MTQPNILPIFDPAKPNAYQLASDYRVTLDGWQFTIPKGFVSDGASVPRFLWSVIPPDGLHRAAALAHDWCYATKGAVAPWVRPISRVAADELFHEGLLATEGVHPATAMMMFFAVRSFGWLPWRRSTGKPRIEPLRYVMT